MQISPASCCLPAEITEIVHIVISHQDVEDVRLVGDSFEPIQLVKRLEGCFYTHEVLRFINEDRAYLQAFQCIDHCIAHIEPLCGVTGLSTRTLCRSKCEVHQMIFDGCMVSEL